MLDIVITTRTLGADASAIIEGARVLRSGGLVAFPTETVYGLGVDATQSEAVARLYEAKGRPRFNPLIAHVADLDQAKRIGRFGVLANRLADDLWPGPLTLVVPAVGDCPVCDLARAGLGTIAIRVPAHPLAHALLTAVGRPVAAPSANRSGHVSATEARHVAADLAGRIELILDGGATLLGLESTILACVDEGPPVLLRPGGVPRERIEAAIGMPLADPPSGDTGRPSAPGQLASHYAPSVPLRLDVEAVRPGEALLSFGAGVMPGGELAQTINLSPSGDLQEAASKLFAALRSLDEARPLAIAVAPIPRSGLGEAIRDRLLRAAAPRG